MVKEKYGNKIKVEEMQFNNPEDYLRLLELQDTYNWHPKKDLTPLLFVDGKFLVGSDKIGSYLEIYIETALSKQGHGSFPKTKTLIDPVSRFKFITTLGVLIAGLVDGINPCAFAAIVFFISFLALQGYTRREVLVIGVSFITAVFIIYVLIGLGIFNFLYQLKAYWLIVKILYIAGALLCFTLGGLAVYDCLRFRLTGQTQNLVLQLPPKLKQRIHRIIGLYYRKDKFEGRPDKAPILRLILSAFAVGCFVSLFESVCIGQVYLPVIVFVLKTTPLKIKAFFYLLIYNLMFIFPLLLILLFAFWGVDSRQLGEFGRKHMGIIKILMAALFLGLGTFLIWQ